MAWHRSFPLPQGLAGLVLVTALATAGSLALSPCPAFAEDGTDHADGGHDGGHGGARGGGSGGHEDGHEEGEHDDGHLPGGGSGGGGPQGTGAQDGQGSGQGAGQAGSGQSRPAWAREGIPEVELGRLNVIRAPAQVLDRAYLEALATLDGKTAAFYGLTLEEMAVELRENWDGVSIIDSPLQNLALLRDALDGESVLETRGIGVDTETLMAAFLGTASDKGIPVTPDTVKAVSTILGQPMDDETAAKLAEDAERIRLAIEEGHG